MACFKKLRKLIVLLVSLFADLFDFVSDWLFYSDLSLAKDGLVFGPQEDLIKTMTLAFCIIGSVTFIMEIILNFIEYDRDSDTVEVISEYLTFSTLLIEDLPQIAINVHIAMCREEATNTIQIVKASAAMFEVVVKLVFIWIKYFLKRRNGGKETGKIRKNLSIFTSVVLLTILVLSATVFYLTTNFQKTQIDFDSDGLSGEESEKYLRGVSIFMRFNTTNPLIPNMADNQWMRLVGLQEITGLSHPSTGVVLSCMLTTPPNVYIWVRSHSTSTVDTISCSQQDSSNFHTVSTQNCSQVFTKTSNITTVSLRFIYVPPNRLQPLGDIHSNAHVYLNNCTEALPPDTLILKYFRVRSEVKDNMTLTATVKGDKFRYHTLPSDLIPVREAWKTGKLMCDSTGRDGPKIDNDISLTCLH